MNELYSFEDIYCKHENGSPKDSMDRMSEKVFQDAPLPADNTLIELIANFLNLESLTFQPRRFLISSAAAFAQPPQAHRRVWVICMGERMGRKLNRNIIHQYQVSVPGTHICEIGDWRETQILKFNSTPI